MIAYGLRYWERLGTALLEHLELVVITLVVSLLIAAVLTIFAMYSEALSKLLIHLFSLIYAIPSLALFALLIPVTGLGKSTAIIALVLYNQYVLLRNFVAGLNAVDPAITEAATGIGMNWLQVLVSVRLPLAKAALFTGVRLAMVSTIGIATIAAVINAGGLGTILFDGLRTMNVNKLLWGSILSAGLALGANAILVRVERALDPRHSLQRRVST